MTDLNQINKTVFPAEPSLYIPEHYLQKDSFNCGIIEISEITSKRKYYKKNGLKQTKTDI